MEYPWTKDGKFYYDRREKPTLISRLNVYSKDKKRKLEVLPYGSSSALANKFGDVKFMTWRDDNNVQHSTYRNNNDDEWIPLEEAFENASGLLPLGQSEDGEFVYLSGRFGDEGISTFVLLHQSGEYKRVFSDHATDIEYVVLDRNGMPAVGITYPSESSYVYAQTETKVSKVHKMLAEAFKGQTATIASHTKDAENTVGTRIEVM